MTRKLTPAQFRSELRRIERKQRQAITKLNQSINNYNRAARSHNARVRANRSRLRREIARLNAHPPTIRYVTYRTSVQTLHRSFIRIEEADAAGTWTAGDELFDLAEGEAANSLAAFNALLDEPATDLADDPQLRQTVIATELREIDPDFDKRWQGALYALSPQNPDAARHFCTSTRELFIELLDYKAPDDAVLAAKPDIKLTDKGQVPRREKIRYRVSLRGTDDDALIEFVDDNINDVMELFGAFNPATHGPAGRYDLRQLWAMKARVEGAILFLCRL